MEIADLAYGGTEMREHPQCIHVCAQVHTRCTLARLVRVSTPLNPTPATSYEPALSLSSLLSLIPRIDEHPPEHLSLHGTEMMSESVCWQRLMLAEKLQATVRSIREDGCTQERPRRGHMWMSLIRWLHCQ